MPVSRDEQLAAELLTLALSDPPAAQERAEALAATAEDPWVLSVARHVVGLSWRERDDIGRALPELSAALKLASATGDADRVADVRATLGATLVMAGRTQAGLRQLDLAAEEAEGDAVAAKVLMRRGYVLTTIVGRHDAALRDLQTALAGIRRAGDRIWEARTLNNIGQLHIALGEAVEAEAPLLEAERIFSEEHQPYESVQVLHNRGQVAYCRGDLPTALRLYDEAADGYAALGLTMVELALDQSLALLTAGLPDEAAGVVDAHLRRSQLQPIEEADLRLRRASALLAAGDGAGARENAHAARNAYHRQRRDWFELRAELVELQAREASGRRDRRVADAAAVVAGRLEAEGAEEAVDAWLLAARLARDGSPVALRRASAYRTYRLPLVRATAWLARGLDAEQAADRRGVLLACRRGLDALDRHRAVLGSTELRALASRHGADLADLALRTALDGSPRRLLSWSERWRASSLSQPRVRPRDDEVAAPLTALRDNAQRLRQAREQGGDTVSLEAERRRLESALRSQLHHAHGDGDGSGPGFDIEVLVAGVGSGSFVELVEVSGTLHALVVSRGRVRRHVVGPSSAADQAAAAARFAMRQAARGRPARLSDVGERLQHSLLGPAAGRLPGPVVVSPTARLHGVPWGLLPALADVPHSVVPSAALWLRARGRRAETHRRAFVAGPGLTTGGSEISTVAPLHPDAVVLRDGAATVDDTLKAVDGAGLAHLAAHGDFRADSPLFSSLRLADGPLLVHDFERLEHAPHRVVMSACDSGVLAPVGAGELLGLVSALLAIGTAGVVASVAVVNDEATVDVMVDVHAALDEGADLATALLRARSSAAGDPTRIATAAAFLALGV